GCRQLRQVEKELPAAGPITRTARKHPFMVLVLLALLPNILGSVVNISYNSVQIVGALEASQRQTFYNLLIGYNAVTYTICLAITCWLLGSLVRTWKELRGQETRGRGDTETRGRGDAETRRRGGLETRGQGNRETRRQGDLET